MPTNPIAKLRELLQGVRNANAVAESNASQLQGVRDDLADFRRWTSEELAGTRDDIAEFRKWISEALDKFEGDHDALRTAARHASGEASRAARRLGLRSNPTRVVFLVHNAATWASLDELNLLMGASDDFDPVVISIPQHYGGFGEARGEQETHEALVNAGVPHLRLTEETIDSADTLLRSLDPDIVIRQSQWDRDVPSQFSPEALAWARTVLVPYETVNVVTNAEADAAHANSAVDSDWHRNCWLVFVANDNALQVAERDSLLGGRQFRAEGHPKIDYLRGIEPQWPIASDDAAPHVLWSAHHSVLSGWNDFGTFPQTCEDMLAWAAARPDVQFVFTHHPLLVETLGRQESIMTPEAYDGWLARWDALPNTGTWSGYYAPVLAACDVVVTDGPSMMVEAQVLGKPVLYLERAEHTAFNEIGQQFAKGVHHVADVAAAQHEFDELQSAGTDPLAETQRQNVIEFFGEPGAAERILEAIRKQIAFERQSPRG